MLNKILVAIDHSDKTRFVVKEAIDLAKSTTAALLFLHVITLTEESLERAAHGASAMPESEVEIQATLKSLTQQAIEAGISAEFTLVHGEAGRSICRIAEEWGADVILLGRRGRSGLSELVLGSVSNDVLHHAPCSVFAIQGKMARTEEEALQHYLDTF